MKEPTVRLLLATIAAIAIHTTEAATIYRCTIDGVQSYQDHPCPERPTPDTQPTAQAQALAHKERTLSLRREELVRMLRHLTLQKQHALKQLEERRLLNDESPPAENAEDQLLREFQQRALRTRLEIEQIDLRLERIKEQRQN
ncbi:MAG TPA: hypothetical protein VIS52_06560 [Motiliproteus sp.]